MKAFKFVSKDNNILQALAAYGHEPYTIYFDSADRAHPEARRSLLFFDPVAVMEDDQWQAPPSENMWMAGLFSYDLGRSLETLPVAAQKDSTLPALAIGFYMTFISADHQTGETCLHLRAEDDAQAQEKKKKIIEAIACTAIPDYKSCAPSWQENLDDAEFAARVQRLIDYIRAGDLFQANMTRAFDAVLPDDFDPLAHYFHLRRVCPAPFSAYMNLGGGRVIASASPERFLQVQDGMITTCPIKGTRPRGKDSAKDKYNRAELENSAKDRAENIMIVDLMRNDLSKICTPDSVDVEKLCDVESFSSVHHLVSTVRGRLADGQTALDALRACFPGGSITGAPKIRAMEIIEELEPARRGAYCGALAFIDPQGNMDSNILIRTLVYESGHVRLQTGAGITADSIPAEETQETHDKARAILGSF
ncbi:MAG: aminodeoxychorismate synthase component I [Alphaproteobacteria bacterium]|nr:aminodeoxychorismate synthase component I [Alphaproteobacteria bacterium]